RLAQRLHVHGVVHGPSLRSRSIGLTNLAGDGAAVTASLRSMRIGVLTGGGDCPGLNAVIRAIVRKGVEQRGHEFVGYRDGWRGPLERDSRPLGGPEVRGILPRGGTILGASRTNPFKEDGGPERIAGNLEAAGVEALI